MISIMHEGFIVSIRLVDHVTGQCRRTNKSLDILFLDVTTQTLLIGGGSTGESSFKLNHQ